MTGLDVNPDKTDMILFTNKLRYLRARRKGFGRSVTTDVPRCVINNIRLKGKEIKLSD